MSHVQEPGTAHRFAVGDHVRVLRERADGNPRTPHYARGRVGTVVVVHGVIENGLDHRGLYPPLCTVQFDIAELTGRQGSEVVTADLHEEWLTPADG